MNQFWMSQIGCYKPFTFSFLLVQGFSNGVDTSLVSCRNLKVSLVPLVAAIGVEAKSRLWSTMFRASTEGTKTISVPNPQSQLTRRWLLWHTHTHILYIELYRYMIENTCKYMFDDVCKILWFHKWNIYLKIGIIQIHDTFKKHNSHFHRKPLKPKPGLWRNWGCEWFHTIRNCWDKDFPNTAGPPCCSENPEAIPPLMAEASSGDSQRDPSNGLLQLFAVPRT